MGWHVCGVARETRGRRPVWTMTLCTLARREGIEMKMSFPRKSETASFVICLNNENQKKRKTWCVMWVWGIVSRKDWWWCSSSSYENYEWASGVEWMNEWRGRRCWCNRYCKCHSSPTWGLHWRTVTYCEIATCSQSQWQQGWMMKRWKIVHKILLTR